MSVVLTVPVGTTGAVEASACGALTVTAKATAMSRNRLAISSSQL
jgi:hypothetical protein